MGPIRNYRLDWELLKVAVGKKWLHLVGVDFDVAGSYIDSWQLVADMQRT